MTVTHSDLNMSDVWIIMTMNLNIRKLKSFVSRCLYKFLLDGSLKAYGVIMEDTVHKFHSQYSIIGLAFSMQVGIGYLIGELFKHIQLARRELPMQHHCIYHTSAKTAPCHIPLAHWLPDNIHQNAPSA